MKSLILSAILLSSIPVFSDEGTGHSGGGQVNKAGVPKDLLVKTPAGCKLGKDFLPQVKEWPKIVATVAQGHAIFAAAIQEEAETVAFCFSQTPLNPDMVPMQNGPYLDNTPYDQVGIRSLHPKTKKVRVIFYEPKFKSMPDPYQAIFTFHEVMHSFVGTPEDILYYTRLNWFVFETYQSYIGKTPMTVARMAELMTLHEVDYPSVGGAIVRVASSGGMSSAKVRSGLAQTTLTKDEMYSALHGALVYSAFGQGTDRLETARLLVQSGGDVNSTPLMEGQSKKEDPLLYEVLQFGIVDSIKFLISAGVDANVRVPGWGDRGEITLIEKAFGIGYLGDKKAQAIELLFDAGLLNQESIRGALSVVRCRKACEPSEERLVKKMKAVIEPERKNWGRKL